MGTDPKSDKEIFGEGYGKEVGIGPQVSEDGRWLLIDVGYGSSGDEGEIWFSDRTANTPLQPLIKRIHARLDAFGLHGDTVFLLTNVDAPNGRIFAIDLRHPERENWKPIVPESDAAIESVNAV